MTLRRATWISAAVCLLFAVPSGPATADDAPAARSVRAMIRVADGGPAAVIDVRESIEPPDARRGLASQGLEVWAGADTFSVADPRLRHVDRLAADGTLEGGPVRRAAGTTVVFLPPHTRELRLHDGAAEARVSLPPAAPLPAADHRRTVRDLGEIEVVTLRDSGPPESRQDLVFLAEGYLEDQLQTFLADVGRVLDQMGAMEPYVRYMPFINVHAVFVGSAEAGADHPELEPAVEVDTALDCTYGAFDVDRIIDCDAEAVLLLAAEAPGEDVRVVLVNDDAYGGSGGENYAVAFTGEQMEPVAIHELGHTDALLGDEYHAAAPYPGFGSDYVNCARRSDEQGWQPWIDIGSPGVGAHPGCMWEDWFRPTDRGCVMHVLDADYCVVCREQVTKAIHTHIPALIEGTSPADDVVELDGTAGATLSISLLVPAGEPFHVVWTWVEQDEVLAEGPGLSEITLQAGDLEDGLWTIAAFVEDRTDWVLDDPFRLLQDRASFFVDVSVEAGDDDDDSGNPNDGSGCAPAGCSGSIADVPASAAAIFLLPLALRRRRFSGT